MKDNRLYMVMAASMVFLANIHVSGNEPHLAFQFSEAVEELRVIGAALQDFKQDYDGSLPDRLNDLVSLGYLPAEALISVVDPYGGTQGGKPDNTITYGPPFYEAYEDGSSYLYESNAAVCSWYSPGYLVEDPPPDAQPSWAVVKQYQLEYGDAINPMPYDERCFPVVRNFWIDYPGAVSNSFQTTVLNLAYDLETVFASPLQWELDQINLTPDDSPELRDTWIQYLEPYTATNSMDAEAAIELQFPLWPKVIDMSGLSYRLLVPEVDEQSQILGTIDGNIFRWRPSVYCPSKAWFTVELSRDDDVLAIKTYEINVRGASLPALVSAVNMNDIGELAVQWHAEQGRTYHIDTTTNLLGPWRLNIYQATGIEAEMFFTTNVPDTDFRCFRIRSSKPD